MGKRRRYKTDPITGIRYEKGSLMDIMGETEKNSWKKTQTFYSPYSRYSRRKRRQTYYREPEVSFSDLPPWAQLLIGLLIVGVLAWIFIFQPFIEWAKQNIVTITIISVVITSILMTGFIFIGNIKKGKKQKNKLLKKNKKQKAWLNLLIDLVMRNGENLMKLKDGKRKMKKQKSKNPYSIKSLNL